LSESNGALWPRFLWSAAIGAADTGQFCGRAEKEWLMSTAHLIHGYLGAGKTTFARHLEGELGAVRFSHDEWMARLYGEDPPAELFADYHQNVWDVMQGTWTRCLTLGLDVVLDLGFWRRAERNSVRSLVSALGASHRLYELGCPEAEAWRRVEARNANLQGSLLITRPTFEFLKTRFEPLADDEDRISIP
jgi:predicted kinase